MRIRQKTCVDRMNEAERIHDTMAGLPPLAESSQHRSIYPGERQADAIRKSKTFAELAYTNYRSIEDALRDLACQLSIVQSTDDAPELKALQDRIERAQELRRTMELGSFKLEVERALDAAWKRLP
jgi:GTP cyclohydrolase FolE2